MKAADIPDELFLAAVIQHNTGDVPDKVIDWGEPGDPDGRTLRPWPILRTGPRWALVWDLEEMLGYPDRIIRAKARKLIRRGELDGCPCGCRGDFEVLWLQRATNGLPELPGGMGSTGPEPV